MQGVCVCVRTHNFKSPSKVTIARSYLTIQINDKELASKIFWLSNLINYLKYPLKRNWSIHDSYAMRIDTLHSSEII